MLYIRADMNKTIATGHIMRCLSIADAIVRLGEEATFILADERPVRLIHERGHQTIVLHSKWNDMDAELEILQKVIDDYKIKSLLIDSYAVTDNYLRVLSEIVQTIYLDDLNAFIYPVHALVCYAVYWKKFCYQERYQETRLLLGMQYTPLRSVFCRCRRKPIGLQVENLLLMSGGTDEFHVLEGLLCQIELDAYNRIDVICGRYYQNYDEFCKRYQHNTQIHFHKSVENIEDYMMRADIAISAGGTTLYELCACGTPAISYSFADNQLENVLQFHKEGLIDYAGDVRYDDMFGNICKILSTYVCEPELRRNRSERMQEQVDGKGSERIAAKLFDMNKTKERAEEL